MNETFGPLPPDAKGSLPGPTFPPAEHAHGQSDQLEPRTFDEYCNGWLNELGVDPTSVPRIILSRPNYELFRNAPTGLAHFVRESLGISGNGYAFVDIPSDSQGVLPDQVLVYFGDDDFGTALAPENLTPENAQRYRGLAPPEVLPADNEFERSARYLARNAARGMQAELEGTGIDETTWRSQCDMWLSAHGTTPSEVPRLSMSPAEYAVFVNMHGDQTQFVKRLYNIVDKDQLPSRYAYIEIAPDDPGRTPTTRLVNLTEVDFGSTMPVENIIKFNSLNPVMPDGPLPNTPNGAVATEDISSTIGATYAKLEAIVARIMEGRTVSPFHASNKDIAVRAGKPVANSAYVWTAAGFRRSIELVEAFPKSYPTVCVVAGEMRGAGNGKAGMAELDNPEVLLEISGTEMKEIVEAYRELFAVPNYALTDSQRILREEALEMQSLFARQARNNAYAAEEREHDDHDHAPKYRSRDPYS